MIRFLNLKKYSPSNVGTRRTFVNWFKVDKQCIQEGKAVPLKIKSCEISLMQVDGNYHAVRDFCPHLGGALSMGDVEGSSVTCPLHGAQFDVTTGAMLRGPGRKGSTLVLYPTKQEEGHLYVGLTEEQLERGY